MVVRSAGNRGGGGVGAPPGASGGEVRVAAAYVQVSARVDERRHREAARRAGQGAGGGFAHAFTGSAVGGMASQRNHMVRSYGQTGGAVGGGFAAAASRSLHQQSGRITDTARRTGQQGAHSFAAGAAAGLLGGGRQLGDQFGRAGEAAGGRFSRDASHRLGAERGHFAQQGSAIGGALVGGVAGSGERAGGGFKSGFGAGMAGFGAVLNPAVGAVSIAAGFMGTQVLGIGKDFQAAMKSVQAVSGATTTELEQLTGLAREMGSTTQFTATQAADALGFLSMAGLGVSESMEALPGVLDLAAAGSLELADAADISTNVLAGFGLEINQLGRLNDVLALASSSANTNVQQLGHGFQYVGPVASAAGLSLEETAAALGMMADAGIQGEKGGTALRGALSRLLQPTSQVQDKLDDLGVTIQDSSGKMRPLADIMGDLEEAGADVTDMLTIFGVEAGPAMMALLQRGADDLRGFTGELEDAEGAAARMAAIKMEGLAGELNGAKSAVEGLWLAIGDMGILDGAARMARVFAGAVRGLTSYLEEHEDTITSVVQVLGTFAGIVAGAVGIFLAAKGAIAGFAGAFALLSNPVGWTILAIGAIGTALVTAWRRSETFRDVLTQVWEKVSAAGGAARRVFDAYVWPGLLWGWENLEGVASTVGTWLTETLFPKLVAGWRQFRDATEPHVTRIVGWLRWLRENADSFGGRWGFLWDFASERLSLFGELVGSWVSLATAQFEGWIDIVTGIMSGDWTQVWDGATTIMRAGWDTLVSTATIGGKLLWGSVKLLFWELPRAIGGWLSDVAPIVYAKARDEWIPAFVGWVGDMERRLAAKISQWRTRFGLWLRGVPGTIRAELPGWTAAFVNWAGGLWSEAETRLAEFTRSLRSWIADRAAELPGFLRAWTTQVGEWAGGLWAAVGGRFDAFVEGLVVWIENFAGSLPKRLDRWTEQLVAWIEGVAKDLPVRMEQWTDEFVVWIETFADSLPEKLERLTDRFVDWATGAPKDTADAFEEADGPGHLEEQIENDWGPRLLAAFGRAIGALVAEIPGMVRSVGEALLLAFARILLSLPDMFDRIWNAILASTGKIWGAIVASILRSIDHLRKEAGRRIGEFVGDTVSEFEGLYDVLVGNSIVPDMVTEIIGETDRLAPGVGKSTNQMSKQAISDASGMATAMTAQMVTMAAAVLAQMITMQRSVAASTQALSLTFISGVASMAAQVQRAYLTMVVGLIAATRQMASQQGSVLGAMGVATVRAFSVMGRGATTEFARMVQQVGRDSASLATVLARVFNSISTSTIASFRRTVAGVRTEWGGLRRATADPVRYLVSPVYNQGLRGVWNRVASKVPSLSPMASMAMPRFADGGLVDMRGGGVQPGYSAKDNRLALFRDGEGVLVPEAVDGLGGPAFINAANRLGGNAYQLLMKGVEAFDRGGVVGLVNRFATAKKGYFKDGAPEAASAALNPMANMAGNKFGRRSDFPGSAYHSSKAWADAVVSVVEAHKAMLEGGDGMAVVAEARKHIGKSGRPNEFMRGYMGGSWPWCGAFVGSTFQRAGAYDALDAVRWKPLVRSYRALPRTTDPMPGDLALYRWDSGHINIVADPETRETIGGNESDSVRRHFGYMNRASSYRRPAFADGGMVDRRATIDLSEIANLSDMAAFWHQDRAETAALLEGSRTSTLRELFPAHLRDTGGLLPDRSAAVNMSGQMETVQTLEQLKAQAAAGSGVRIQEVHVHVDTADFDSMKKVVSVFEKLRPVSRMHGSTTHVGAP